MGAENSTLEACSRTDGCYIVRYGGKGVCVNTKMIAVMTVLRQIKSALLGNCCCAQPLEMRGALDLRAGGAGGVIGRITDKNGCGGSERIQFFGNAVASPDIRSIGKEVNDTEFVFLLFLFQTVQCCPVEPDGDPETSVLREKKQGRAPGTSRQALSRSAKRMLPKRQPVEGKGSWATSLKPSSRKVFST